MARVRIELTNGLFAIIDDIDFDLVVEYNWQVLHTGNIYYARTTIQTGITKETVLMHRLILSAGSYDLVDHRDGNGLHNWRDNIRLCTNQQNSRNANIRSDNTSGYKGVSYHTLAGKWQSCIKLDGKTKYLGLYQTPEEAAMAYNEAAIKLHGDFAKLNEVIPCLH